MSSEQTPSNSGENEEQPKASWKTAVVAEVRGRPFAYSVMAVGLVLGPVLIRMIFPEVSVLQAIVGGIAFGVYAALSAVPQKFM